MSIYFSIQAETHQEFIEKLTAAYTGFCATVEATAPTFDGTIDLPADSRVDDAGVLHVAPSEEGPKAQRRRGRPKKTETQEAAALAPAAEPVVGDASADAVFDAPPPVASVSTAGPATKDEVRTALQDYVAKHGMPEGRALTQKVCGEGVLSLSQIPEDKYAAMVEACRNG